MQRKGRIDIGSHLFLLIHRIASLHQMVHIPDQMVIGRRLGLLQQLGVFYGYLYILTPLQDQHRDF